MFIHYYRYKERYVSKTTAADERLTIVYPTDPHAMITTGHDFYVIGTFQGIKLQADARLQIELIELASGKKVRTVFTEKKDNREGMNVHYAGIETQEDMETVRSCGMPDLVYDPADPVSFGYTWNKAYYTDHVFSALICGGTCQLDGMCPYDQFGERLQPLAEGYYELKVTLENEGERIASSKTIWLTDGKKEIILSRFSPDTHVARVQEFVRTEGFEAFTDPYAGIWDTQYFSIDWPVKAWVEIPERWHFGDAQEYESGTVHFFDYNISQVSISWKTEIGTMLAKDRTCVNNPKRLLTYFYENGAPDVKTEQIPAGTMNIMAPGQYFQITNQNMCVEGRNPVLHIEAICKPVEADTEQLSVCAYEPLNRVAYFDYSFFQEQEDMPFFVSTDHKTGVISEKADAPDEFLILHVRHRIELPECPEGTVCVRITARDLYGEAVEMQEHDIPFMDR